MKSSALPSRLPARQQGAAAVEFALVASVFFTLWLGAMEFGRVLYLWNTAAEATRWGARIATVCDLDDAQIKGRMMGLMPMLGAADIAVSYLPGGCTVDTCESVTVQLTATTPVQTYIPFLPTNLILPSFTTTLTRESLQSVWPGAAGGANPVCI